MRLNRYIVTNCGKSGSTSIWSGGTLTSTEENSDLERLQEEVADLRRRLVDAPVQIHDLETELRETKKEVRHAIDRNQKLDEALEMTRQRVSDLREEIEQLSKPPSPYGTVVGINEDGSIDVQSSGKKMRVSVSPEVGADLGVGQVVLNRP